MNSEKKYGLDNPRNVRKIVYTLYAVCALLIVGDLFYRKHIHFDFEDWPGFFAWFGFLACVCLVLAAKGMRKLLKREEDYYD